MSFALDIGAVLLVALCAFVGFAQGFSVIILRCLVVFFGILSFHTVHPHCEGFLTQFLGDSASLGASVLMVLAILFSQQIMVWVYIKLTSAAMLRIPDRIFGFLAGVLVSYLLVVLICLKMSHFSNEFKDHLSRSEVVKFITPVEDMAKKIFGPEMFNKIEKWLNSSKV